MDQHILVPFDGSTLAKGMLAHVQALAKSLGAEGVFLRVALTHIVPGADAIQAQAAAVQHAIDSVSGPASWLQAEEVRAEVKECDGDPVEEILDHVARITSI
jgi:Universal stress protein family